MTRGAVLANGAALAFALGLAGGARAELTVPAELPPPDYAGQQYVDTKGCLFLRAGQPGQTVWIPRVTREGRPLCDNPPSGRRAPVAEGAAAEAPEAAPEATPAAGEVYVAVGSFGVAGNVDKAVAMVRASGYGATLGPAPGGGALVTVYAGPFATRDAAQAALAPLRAAGFPDAIVIGP